MAVKTITIDMMAYRLLAGQKQGDESFSRVIKRRLPPSRTAADLLAGLGRIALDPQTLDRMDDVVKRRRLSPASSPTPALLLHGISAHLARLTRGE